MRIAPLAERPDLVHQVAVWGHGEWGPFDPGSTLESRLAHVRESLNVAQIPITFVALADDGTAVGTAALILDDLEGDPRNPWLASVYVPPAHRKRGIASALVRAVEDAARRIGHRRLYLFTSTAPRLYQSLGWRPLETRDYRGETIQVMDRTL